MASAATRRLRRTAALLGASALVASLVAVVVPASASAPTTTGPRTMVTGWMPYWLTSESLASVIANADVIGEVMPFWYDAYRNSPNVGISANVSSSTVSTVTAALHAHGVKVLPSITDGSGWHTMSTQLSTGAGRAYMVSAITSLVTSHGFDGIDLDWETFAFGDGQSTWATTRPRWDAFVNSLAASLHAKGKLLSLTVPGGWPAYGVKDTGYGVYDWTYIGARADRVRIMAYDYSTSTAGPIAPLWYTTDVIRQAITQIPAEKVWIGIASYGRDWYKGTSGTCPNTGVSSTLSSRMSWATARHEYDARGASTFNWNQLVNSSTLTGMKVVSAPTATWNAAAAERTFSYQVGFSGAYQAGSFPVTPIGAGTGSTAVHVASAAGVVPGMTASGAYVAAGSKVTSVGLKVVGGVADRVGLSLPLSANATGAITFTAAPAAKATGAKAATTVVLDAATTAPTLALVRPGATVSGSAAVPAGTTVTKVDTVTRTVTLSKALAAAVAGSLTFTLTKSTVAVGGYATGTTIDVASNAGMAKGASVTGPGIAAGATVASTPALGHSVTLTKPNVGSVYTTLTDKPAAVSTTCTVSRTGWYSDASSAAVRAALVGTYKIGGLAEWTFGGEDTAQWAPLRAKATEFAPLVTSITTTAPARVAYGATGQVSAVAQVGGVVKAGVTVAFEWNQAGTATWTARGSAATDAHGVARLTTPPVTADGTWRAVIAPTWAAVGSVGIAPAVTVAVGTPTSVTLSAPARLVYAQHGSVTAVAKVAGVVKAGVSVSFQWLPAGATAWTVKGSVLTDATGTAKFTTPVVTTTGRWRVVVTSPGLISSNASATAPTVLVPLINASPTSLTLKKGGKATISAGFAPTTSNQRILLQRRVGTGWVAVATLVTSTRSIVRYAAPTTSIGTRTYRWVVYPTAKHAAATSRLVVVKVS